MEAETDDVPTSQGTARTGGTHKKIEKRHGVG